MITIDEPSRDSLCLRVSWSGSGQLNENEISRVGCATYDDDP